MKCYYTRYTVEQANNARFPIAMLAMDDASPASQTNAERIGESYAKGGKCSPVLLQHIGTDKGWTPNVGFWMVNGWRVRDSNTTEIREEVVETDDTIEVDDN